MIAMLLWIVCCYAVAVAAVHLVHRWQTLRGSKPVSWRHVVIVTENDERYMEWLIQAYCWFAWLKGQRLHITVVDEGSKDCTEQITRRVVRRHGVSWEWKRVSCAAEREYVLQELERQQAPEEALVVIRPQCIEDWAKVPFMARGAL
ncbi:glycosyltransferase [Paenibacillus sp. 481]|uniref:glycosyltransferase n=1 Tax=Paenibacillus sp. 481 TaxID=2835869 RepID=UPI001E653F48|nr:glycosyltransferase [Paenibacillus sp. 481]UHA75702.1 glycosyltransferase [Paenibacillus sp. 481]